MSQGMNRENSHRCYSLGWREANERRVWSQKSILGILHPAALQDPSSLGCFGQKLTCQSSSAPWEWSPVPGLPGVLLGLGLALHYSRNCNPCDYFVCSYLETMTNRTSHNTMASLIIAIEAWIRDILVARLKNTCVRLRSRLEQLLAANGGYFE